MLLPNCSEYAIIWGAQKKHVPWVLLRSNFMLTTGPHAMIKNKIIIFTYSFSVTTMSGFVTTS